MTTLYDDLSATAVKAGASALTASVTGGSTFTPARRLLPNSAIQWLDTSVAPFSRFAVTRSIVGAIARLSKGIQLVAPHGTPLFSPFTVTNAYTQGYVNSAGDNMVASLTVTYKLPPDCPAATAQELCFRALQTEVGNIADVANQRA